MHATNKISDIDDTYICGDYRWRKFSLVRAPTLSIKLSIVPMARAPTYSREWTSFPAGSNEEILWCVVKAAAVEKAVRYSSEHFERRFLSTIWEMR